MAESVHHCPFLNRAEIRCSENFSLDRLDHAFRYCFDRYNSCAVYRELLGERHGKQGATGIHHGEHSYVQITIGHGADRFAQRPARAAAVPAVSGV